MDLVAIVKERAEGKDLSVLGGSVKFVVDENVVLIDGNSGEITSDDNEARAQFQQMQTQCNQLWMVLQVHKLLL